MHVSRKILWLLAILVTIPFSESFAQEETDPLAVQATPDRRFTGVALQLKAPHRGYFLTEVQIEKLTPDARAEVEKLLAEKTEMTTFSYLTDLDLGLEGVNDEAAAAPIKLSRYMLGVVVVSHKDEEAQGVLITKVTEDSPARKSGLRSGDTILKVNETEISDLQSLMNAVDASEGEEIALTILRTENAESVETVQVTPVERPQETHPDPAETAGHLRKLGQWKFLENFQPNYDDLEINFDHEMNGLIRIHPGIVLGQNPQPLPGNLSVTIKRQGTQPARITVKRDELTWELTEQELDKLPADVRPHVDQLLGGGNQWRYGLY
ncbi:MAG TPA: PDZ domain-containing protein, partial [Planctomycetaceae bacterium]|nr:PDZ domain-containing protein [Planctomycetaceae bacterium]